MIDHPRSEEEAIAWWKPRVPPGCVRALSTPMDAKPWTLLFVYEDETVVVIQVAPEGDLLLRHRETRLATAQREYPPHAIRFETSFDR